MLLHETFAATPVDRESLPQGALNIDKRVRTNPFTWTGQFSPQLVEALLEIYAPDSGVVLDPFVGSGTLLAETARIHLAARGYDVNPAAVTLAQVYRLANLDALEKKAVLEELGSRLFDKIGLPEGPLFLPEPFQATDQDALEALLVDLWRESSSGLEKILAAALVVLCDFYRKDLNADKVHGVWRRIRQVVRTLPESDQPVEAHLADARSLPLASGSVDLVLTSPPYINVQNYHQLFRRSVEALSWDVLAVARSEIGSNRQNRGNRFLTVIQYSLDMVLALREMARVTKPGGRLILVLGRVSRVLGVAFFNGELVAELAVQGAALEFEKRQERVFRNRYGADIYEDILHFRKIDPVPDEDASLRTARGIAEQVLSAAGRDVSRNGITDAIASLDRVPPSPILDPGAVRH